MNWCYRVPYRMLYRMQYRMQYRMDGSRGKEVITPVG